MPTLLQRPRIWHNGPRLYSQELDLKPLFALFWQICRFQRGPEDVPYAPALAGLLVVVVAGLSGLSVLILNSVAPPAADAPQISDTVQLLVQWLALGAWLAIIFLLLRFKNMTARFTQTVIAALGTDIIMTAPQLIGFVILASSPPESALAALGQFSVLVVYIWDMLIKGHIYSRAMNISRLQGNLLSLALSYGVFAISVALFPIQT